MAEQLSDIQRFYLARKLFQQWNGLTHTELATAMWNKLPPEDRQHWLDQVDAGVRPRKEEV